MKHAPSRAALLFGWIVLPGFLFAQSDSTLAPADLETILARLASVAQRLSQLEAQLADQENAAARLPASPVVSAGRDGFSVRSPDSHFQFKIGGYFQSDGRFFAGPGQPEATTFVLRRVRPVLTGTVFNGIDFRLMPDWAQGAAVLQDLHLDFRFFPKASIRFGKFKAPFGLERLQSATDMTFIERAYPTSLAPNRDTGIQVYGDFGTGTFSYAVAAMNGVPDGGSSDFDTNDGKDFVGRAFVQPFVTKGTAHKAAGLGFGIAASYGPQTGAALPAYRTAAQSTFFTYAAGTAADGTRRRIGPQGHYYRGPFGLFGEYTVSTQHIRSGMDARRVRHRAWQAAVSYYLTGESKAYRAPSPSAPFDRQTGGKGAVEVAARYTELTIDRSVFELGFADSTQSAQQAREWTAGINWHVVRGTKFALHYSHTAFTGGSAAGDRAPQRTLFSRFQVAF